MSRVCFGDVVREVKENVDRSNNPYEYYIAGDHMDTEELHITRRGNFSKAPEPGPAFIRAFRSGQILYGSRRTYLKKVSVANFDGVCANTTFVLETKDDNVFLQRLLPFLMYSERFTQYSINNSKGSTNPYILFSDLAKYEFDLPPLTKQRKLADLLWAANTARVAHKKLLAATDELVKSRFVEMFGDPVTNPKGWERGTIRDIATDVRYGTSKPAIEGGIYPYLRMNNITYDGYLDLSDLKTIDISEKEIEKCIVKYGDVLFNRTNSKELVGKTCVFTSDVPMIIAGYIIRIRLNHKAVPIYLSAILNSDYGKMTLRSMCKAII
ncbi:MAG: restriction endonuclease subunit S, partial [Treponema sp.]|nr:restriction endonuclease subunit S [Treponema sp.]